MPFQVPIIIDEPTIYIVADKKQSDAEDFCHVSCGELHAHLGTFCGSPIVSACTATISGPQDFCAECGKPICPMCLALFDDFCGC